MDLERHFRRLKRRCNLFFNSRLMDLERHFPLPKGCFGSFFNSLLTLPDDIALPPGSEHRANRLFDGLFSDPALEETATQFKTTAPRGQSVPQAA
jgi:hypothetical protein